MPSFDEFSEAVERLTFNSWRSVIGRGNDDVIGSVSSILFTREDKGGEWEFSFSLRVEGRWVQSYAKTEPVEYDPYDPPPVDEYDPKRSSSPENTAGGLAIEMLTGVARKLGCDEDG